MHLYWENVVPMMFDHWRGRFFNTKQHPAAGGGHDGAAVDSGDVSKKYKSKKGARSEPKFAETDKEYNINKRKWEEISLNILNSRATVPVLFGEVGRSLVAHCQHYKAMEWQNWGLLLSPILLKGVLPDKFYIPFMRLISAFTTSMDTIIQLEEIDLIRSDIAAFIYHYEEEYYRYEWSRLGACTSQIHYLAHVADVVDWLGLL